MSTTHHHLNRRAARLLSSLAGLAGLAAILLGAASAPAALAVRVPPGGATRPRPRGLPVQTVVVGGMPGWQITAIALGAALAAAVTVILAGRVRSGRRHLPATTV